MMISYAQNFEDVILNRVFYDINKGFYIDVGANDPIIHSVTKNFYDKGWRGINIEPVKAHFDSLQNIRPDDINLRIAISIEEGTIDFWESEIRGLSTASQKIINTYSQNGSKGHLTQVPALPLSKVCEEYVHNNDIHFLKIDVEGLEKSVIQSNNWKKFRPWVVVVEATLPNSQIESFEEWEMVLLENNYKFVYADGLNRFYLAKEHIELKDKFKYPPNYFDKFVLYTSEALRKLVIELRKEKDNLLKKFNEQKIQNTLLVDEKNYLLKQFQLEKDQLIKNFEFEKSNLIKDYDIKCSEISDQISLLSSKLKTQETMNRLLSIELISHKCKSFEKIRTEENLNLEFNLLKDEYDKTNITSKKSIEKLQMDLSLLRTKYDASNLKVNKLTQEIESLFHSNSWKLTKPLREFRKFLKDMI